LLRGAADEKISIQKFNDKMTPWKVRKKSGGQPNLRAIDWKDGSSMQLTQDHNKQQGLMLQCENFTPYYQFNLVS
jgi:hypothetical protein